jgi:LysR family transcriptional regulator, transcriptional activator of the cysJI operon
MNTDDRQEWLLVSAVAEGVQPNDLLLNPVRLAIFRTVVERHSFTRAAEELSLAQSTVSGHIRLLESAFGSPLFDRRQRGAQFTEVGQAAYDFAIAVQRELDALRAQVRDLAGGLAGAVTLGAPVVPGTHVLPELLAHFHRQRPAAELRLRLLPPESIGEEVLHGHLDMGIVNESTVLPAAVWREPLWCETVMLVAASDHPLAKKPHVSLEDLAGQPFVIGCGRTGADQALNQALARAGLPPRHIVMEAGNQDGARQAARQGVGLAVLYRRVVSQDLTDGKLVILPMPELPGTEQQLLVFRPAHRFTPLAQQLIAFLQAAAPQLTDSAAGGALH